MVHEQMPTHDKPPQTPEEVAEVESHMDPVKKQQSRVRNELIEGDIPHIAKEAEKLGMTLEEVHKAGILFSSNNESGDVFVQNLKGHRLKLGFTFDNRGKIDNHGISGEVDGKVMQWEDAKAVLDKYFQLFKAFRQDLTQDISLSDVREKLETAHQKIEKDPYYNAVKDLMA